ncbi:amino acid ABC transporter substrate-binding protein [Lysinibacillus alkalisoli]|uniref:Amino acid ABC transporter substrate-binding protein n=1 Tax=Lysinibacillus alkalisoli TaxID=1911548 RepID=A0A917FYF2_9BACI|nr:amino acid ABC transporter permease [Lysinibacillus alkalisoli]GGG14158.1 amino acid ABC transporter substrate-binding protein [Lysinibacillus alkalisoli]
MSLEWMFSIVENNWHLFLRAMGITLLIAIVGTIVGAVIGFIIGIIDTIPKKQTVKNYILRVINFILTCYVEFFRGTPMMVQAMIVYFGLDLAFGIDLNILTAGILVVSLNTGAYMAEIVRGGIIAIEKGQYEAAQAVGMTHFQTMVYVVLPQVWRNSLPATGNQLVMNIKDTAVLSVIGVNELFFQAKSISGANFRYFETFFIASILYLIMTFTATRLLRYMAKRLDGPQAYDKKEVL